MDTDRYESITDRLTVIEEELRDLAYDRLRDRARDVLHARAGYRTLRFTDRQLDSDPSEVAAAIAAVLADRRAA